MRSVGLPLRSEGQVVLHPLVTEVHVLVAPVGCGELRVQDHLANLHFGASKLNRFIHRVDIPEVSGKGDGGELLCVVSVAVSHSAGELDLTAWLESQAPGEDRRGDCATLRIEGSHVGKTDSLDPVSSCSESYLEWQQGLTLGCGNMVVPVICEEVQIVLAIDTEHGDEVGRIDSISEKLHTHAGFDVRSISVNW